MNKINKELVFSFEYKVDPEEVESISEILEKMRETGSAEIVDVSVLNLAKPESTTKKIGKRNNGRRERTAEGNLEPQSSN